MKYFIVLLLTVTSLSFAQQTRVSVGNDKPRVAILPFDANQVSETQVFDKEGVGAFAEAAAQKVLTAFVDLKRFVVIERAAIDKILKEQNFQMGEFSDANSAANLGNLLGTQYIVQGQIQSVNTIKKDKKFKATVSIHIRIIDVSSGQVKASKDVTGSSKEVKTLTSKIAYDALNTADIKIGQFIRGAFPIEGKLVKLLDEDTKKKDKKQKAMALISCGKDLGVNVGDQFTVVQEEQLTVDGKSYMRQKKIGKLKLKRLEMDGIFSVCEITEGEKALKAELEKGNELKVLSSDE